MTSTTKRTTVRSPNPALFAAVTLGFTAALWGLLASRVLPVLGMLPEPAPAPTAVLLYLLSPTASAVVIGTIVVLVFRLTLAAAHRKDTRRQSAADAWLLLNTA
jgi:hypothetical protein